MFVSVDLLEKMRSLDYEDGMDHNFFYFCVIIRNICSTKSMMMGQSAVPLSNKLSSWDQSQARTMILSCDVGSWK